MRLSVVICTWNRAESLQKTLESIENCRIPSGMDWEILIADNNSTDATSAVCQSFMQRNSERYRYLCEKRQGKSFALNTAIENARGDILAFTDDDVLVEPNWLFAVLTAFDAIECIGVAGKIVPVWNSPKPAWFNVEGPYRLMLAIVEYDLGDQSVACQIDNPPYGANLALRKDVFARYGLFRTDLGPVAGTTFRGEDSEYCRRLMSRGEKLIYVPGAVVYHPVPEDRTKKRYFESWYFDYGRMLVRTSRPSAIKTSYFGIPRYMLRKILTCVWQWNTSFEQKRRFYHRLQVCQTLGEIAEFRNIFNNERTSGKTGEAQSKNEKS
jgi:glycosyltransferase involved in cell wall biosynthesis